MSHEASVHARGRQGLAQELRARRHAFAADEPEASGGADSAPNPMELYLGGLAACTAITLRMYAQRKGFELGDVKVDCRLVRDGDAVRVERTVRIDPPPPEERRARLAEIAEKTPVTKLVKAGVAVATTFA